MEKRKKKIAKRTKFVIIAIANITLFTIAVLLLNAYGKEVSDSLIVSFFSAWTVELALLAGIKIKNQGDGYQITSEEDIDG